MVPTTEYSCCTKHETRILSKKFAKIGLSTTRGGGFNPDFCFAPRIFQLTHAFRAKPSQDITATRGRGFQILTKYKNLT
jgi:hypothetical protein